MDNMSGTNEDEELVEFNLFLGGADLDSRIPDLSKPSPEVEAVDHVFRERAERALVAAETSALDLLDANAGISKVELAKRLNRGANAGWPGRS